MRLLLALLALSAAAAPTPSTISQRVATWKSMPGYFSLYYDPAAGKLYLEIDKWGKEFLFQDSLPAGVGSNDPNHDCPL